MRKINPKIEKLRRKKISETLKRKHRNGIWKPWNKGLTKDIDDRIKNKMRPWLGKKNPGQSKRMKGNIPWNKGLKGYNSGAKNPRWKGGIDKKEDLKIRNSIECREWRRQIIKRDKKCQVCGSLNYLEAHHIKSFTNFPNLRFDLSNGILLCVKCHKNLQ